MRRSKDLTQQKFADQYWVLLEEKLKEIIGTRDAVPNVPAFAPAHLDTAGQDRAEPDFAAELAALKRQNQELAEKVAAMEEEDALLKPMDTSEVSPSVSDGTLSPMVK